MSEDLLKSATRQIKQKAIELGFQAVGVSKAVFLETPFGHLQNWLSEGMHGEMTFMEKHVEKRADPRKLVDGAKSVISVGCNYFSENRQPQNTYKVSIYAYGRDYHDVLKEKLNELLAFIKTIQPSVHARIFVDSAPVMEKAWAAKSGLGWIGKNTNLISKEHGSFLFLGEIILDMELLYDEPVESLCKTCTKCIDACPTNALTPYSLDARKCISYLTIEKRKSIPDEFQTKMNDWIFGCDICQNVCPWNSKAKQNNEPDFLPKKEITSYSKSDWENLNPESFERIFRGTALQRAKFQGIKRNICFVKSASE